MKENTKSMAQKSTMGTPKSGAKPSAYSLPEVKIPFGGNVSVAAGRALPKAPKGLC